jgi:hypothetical protein
MNVQIGLPARMTRHARERLSIETVTASPGLRGFVSDVCDGRASR